MSDQDGDWGWWIATTEGLQGPFTQTEMFDAAAAGRLLPGTLIRKGDDAGLTAARELFPAAFASEATPELSESAVLKTPAAHKPSEGLKTDPETTNIEHLPTGDRVDPLSPRVAVSHDVAQHEVGQPSGEGLSSSQPVESSDQRSTSRPLRDFVVRHPWATVGTAVALYVALFVAGLIAAYSMGIRAAPVELVPQATVTVEVTPPVPVETPTLEPQVDTKQPGFVITPESRTDLANYSSFTYATAVTQGLSPEAGSKADEAIASMVDVTVNEAVQRGLDDCAPDDPPCQVFELTLTPKPCPDGYVCLLQTSLWLSGGPGFTDTQSLVLGIDSGAPANLTDFVPPESSLRLQGELNVAVGEYLRSQDVDATDIPVLSLADVRVWIPTSNGFEVYFDKREIAAGYVGSIEVFVRNPDPSRPLLVPLSEEQARPILEDLDLGDWQPLQCFGIVLSASDPDWGWLGISRSAISDPNCDPFDGVTLVSGDGGRWRQTDLSGSFFDCELDTYLRQEGAPEAARRDLDFETGC